MFVIINIVTAKACIIYEKHRKDNILEDLPLNVCTVFWRPNGRCILSLGWVPVLRPFF